MTDLTFYTNPMSRGRIVRWMLEEVGTAYETVVLDYATTMKAPDYLAVNPMGKVPAIVHRGHAVTECAAICAYLAEAFPGAGLGPDEENRASYWRWLFFAAGPVEQAITDRTLRATPSDQQQGMVGYGSYERMVDALEQAVAAGPFVAGDRFTAADVYVGSQVMWGLQFGSLPARDAFAAYAAGLGERPAYRRAGEIDDALIAAPPA